MKTPKITIDEIRRLLVSLKKDIGEEYRACEDEEIPGMQVTIGADETGWSYQTGDNSYTGGAYGYANWAVIYLYRDSNCLALARTAKEELAESMAWRD
jgi:hypothetical protein